MPNAIPITNNIALLDVIGRDMEKVIADVVNAIIEIIKKSILENVYDLPKGEEYERLGEYGGFLGAWDAEEIQRVGNLISSRISMNPDLMKYDAEQHQHGNLSEDRRDRMDKIILFGRDYDFGGNASAPRDYWTFVENWIDSGQADFYIERAFNKYGIAFRRGII